MYDPLNTQNNQNNQSNQNNQNTQNPGNIGNTGNGQGAQRADSQPQSSYYNPGYGGYSRQEWNSGQGRAASSPSSQTVWSGSSYHYSAGAPQPPQHPVPPKAKKERKEKKHSRLGLKIAACLLACLLISGGSIAGFAALVNSGYIQLGAAAGGNSADPAFTLHKLIDNTSGNSTTTTGALTVQEAAKKAIPSVVSVLNYQKIGQQGSLYGSGRPGSVDPEDGSESEQESSEGSGIIATADGYIITNAHVVSGADSLYVVLSDGTKYPAELIGSDSVTDLAVLKIEATGLTAAEFGSSEDLQIGEQVIAIGNPGGLGSTTTVGYVSALNRTITASSGYTMDYIQTDAAINPGNSGGALVNLYGQVVGINSSKISATEYEGLGFAIPIDTAQSIVSSLKEYGYVKDRAVLGISGKYLDAYTARFYNLEAGMYISEVNNPSVAQAGVTKGCVITKIDDTAVNSQTAITAYLVSKKPGDTVTLTVYNGLDDETFTAKVTLIESSHA